MKPVVILTMMLGVVSCSFAIAVQTDENSVLGGNLPRQNEQEQIQALLDAVCRAQKPTRNMRVKWISETFLPIIGRRKGRDVAGGEYASERQLKMEFSATISGIRSRIEYLQKSYEAKDSKEPHRVTHNTRVFNGTTQRMLEKPIKAKRTKLLGRQYAQDMNSSALRYRLFEWSHDFELRDQEIRKKYKFSLIESDIPGIYIVEALKEYGSRYRLTIDSERGSNVIKFERIRVDDSKDFEVNTTLKQYADGIWYVAGRELIRHPLKGIGPDKPYVLRRMHVTQAEFNIEIPEGAFELEFPIGTTVWDGVLEEWFVVGDVEDPHKQEQIQALLDAVCRAQKPTPNMRVKWIYERFRPIIHRRRAGNVLVGTRRELKMEFSATISGIRSRIERLVEMYAPPGSRVPYKVTHETEVFDGTTQRMLSKPIKAERTKLSGKQYAQDMNSSALRYRFFEWPDAFELRDQEIRKRYKFSLIESDIPGIYIVEALKEYGSRYRLTIDSERGSNVIKFERIRVDDSKDFEVNTTLKQYADGIWYVAGRELIRHPSESLGRDKPYVQRTIHVTQAEFNIEIPEGTFELEFPIGTEVDDDISGDSFVVGDQRDPHKEDEPGASDKCQQ